MPRCAKVATREGTLSCNLHFCVYTLFIFFLVCQRDFLNFLLFFPPSLNLWRFLATFKIALILDLLNFFCYGQRYFLSRWNLDSMDFFLLKWDALGSIWSIFEYFHFKIVFHVKLGHILGFLSFTIFTKGIFKIS